MPTPPQETLPAAARLLLARPEGATLNILYDNRYLPPRPPACLSGGGLMLMSSSQEVALPVPSFMTRVCPRLHRQPLPAVGGLLIVTCLSGPSPFLPSIKDPIPLPPQYTAACSRIPAACTFLWEGPRPRLHSKRGHATSSGRRYALAYTEGCCESHCASCLFQFQKGAIFPPVLLEGRCPRLHRYLCLPTRFSAHAPI